MNTKEFKEGIKDGLPICIGYFSVSIAFGLSCVQMGMPAWLAVLTSLTNLTSAGQFAGATFLMAHANYLEVAVTLFVINMRYFFMSFSVSQKLTEKFSIGKRLVAGFGITDEIFAVSMQRKGTLTFPYMSGLMLTPIAGWTLGTFVGAIATSVLPTVLTDALGIALYAMFIAVIVPPAKEEKNVRIAVGMAIAASYLFTYLPGLRNLSGGWATIIVTVSVSMIAAVMFPVEAKEAE